MAAGADDASHPGATLQVEVGACQGGLHVADDRTAALAVDVVVNWMAKHLGLVCGSCVDLDFFIARAIDEPVLCGRISRLLVEHVIIGSIVAGRLGLIQPVDRRHEIGMLPARREEVVKIGCRRLKEQPGIDGARAADGATNVGVDLGGGTGQTGRARKDGAVEPWYVDTTQVGTYQPLWSLGPSSDAI